MNRVNLSNCDKEAIHLLGTIQSFGCLLALDANWQIAYVSDNTEFFFGKASDQLLGRTLKSILGYECCHAIRSAVQTAQFTKKNERLLSLNLLNDEQVFDVSVHVAESLIIIEIEKANAGKMLPENGLRAMLMSFNQADSIDQLLNSMVAFFQKISGFDRVMIYQFLADGCGEVVAERTAIDVDSFLGLRYPASDIPQQARALYKQHLLRIIADVNASPVPIIPAHTLYESPVNLSGSVTRAVSPIHYQYLKNMGVGGSMSISIMVKGELWGLIACHHLSPKHISFGNRTELELMGEFFSLELTNQITTQLHESSSRKRQEHNQLLALYDFDSSFEKYVQNHIDKIKTMINNDGIAFVFKDRVISTGESLEHNKLQELRQWLSNKDTSAVVTVNSYEYLGLDAVFDGSNLAGFIAIPLSKVSSDYLLFFRKRVVQSVKWAGNPEKPVQVIAGEARLQPRKSFDAYIEQKQDACIEWSANDEVEAEALRVTLLEIMLNTVKAVDDHRKRAQERQTLLISELNHRVRNILTLTKAIIHQTSQNGRNVEEFVEVLNARIGALAIAHEQLTKKEWAGVSLTQLLNTEIQAYINKANKVFLSGSDVLIKAEASITLVLVLHEMFTNAAKYGPLLDSSGKIKVEYVRQSDDSLVIHWVEIGGPPVAQAHTSGFGGTLIRKLIPHELDGEVDYRLETAGVTATFLIPAKHLDWTQTSDVGEPHVHPVLLEEQLKVENMSVLVLEDNLIIAMDVEQKVKELGVKRIQVVGDVHSAKAILNKSRPDVAILDVNLGEETSFAIAEELVAAGTQIMFVTGYGKDLGLPRSLSSVPIIQKPFKAPELLEVLESLFD